MHDPMTVAFEIPYPWRKYPKGHQTWPNGYRETAVTVWHVDPERDGSDDSCGWFAPKGSTEKERQIIADLLREERAFPYYFAQPTHRHSAEYDYPEVRPGDCIALVYGVFHLFAARLEGRWKLTTREIDAAIGLAVLPHDNFQASFAASDDRDRERTLLMLLRNWKRIHRPWWQHPRWHIRHWKIQVQAVQSFKRWAFTRCKVCGGRFSWGAEGMTNSWHPTGPRWFRGEKDLTHMACAGYGGPVTAPTERREPSV
jgi:hypothetical protein